MKLNEAQKHLAMMQASDSYRKAPETFYLEMRALETQEEMPFAEAVSRLSKSATPRRGATFADPAGQMTPLDRSRAALPANIRKTLEESDLPIEVATAIADLCEMRPEEALRKDAERYRWLVENPGLAMLAFAEATNVDTFGIEWRDNKPVREVTSEEYRRYLPARIDELMSGQRLPQKSEG